MVIWFCCFLCSFSLNRGISNTSPQHTTHTHTRICRNGPTPEHWAESSPLNSRPLLCRLDRGPAALRGRWKGFCSCTRLSPGCLVSFANLPSDCLPLECDIQGVVSGGLFPCCFMSNHRSPKTAVLLGLLSLFRPPLCLSPARPFPEPVRCGSEVRNRGRERRG